MGTEAKYRWLAGLALLGFIVTAGCDGLAVVGGGTLLEPGENENALEPEENENAPEPDLITVETYATNTGRAAAIALDAAGDLYLVNERGLFGPIQEGDDVATLDPIGATNISDEEEMEDFFDNVPSSLVLAISNSGEFWISTPANATMAVVPPEGGPAEPFTGLLTDPTPDTASKIKPATMAIVPDEFDGAQIRPGTLLVGRETFNSELSTIDVESADRTVLNIDNPINPDELEDPDDGLRRWAHHVTFAADGTLYTSAGQLRLGAPGIQTIAPDGAPSNVAGTEAILAHTFVVLDNGDLVIRGSYDPVETPEVTGLLLWSAEDAAIVFGLDLPVAGLSEHDELILGPTGKTLFLSLPGQQEILLATDNR